MESAKYTLIDWKVNLILTWSANCVITSMEKQEVRAVQGDNPEFFNDSPTIVTLIIKDTKLYVPVDTCLKQDDYSDYHSNKTRI